MPTDAPTSVSFEITVTPMKTAQDARAFRELNEEWISALFTLEASDHRLLGDPFGEIVGPGGAVLVARAGKGSDEPVGCVALINEGEGRFELAKMTVDPALRGQGLGRTIILAAIEHARSLGARTLFLGSSNKLANAVHLYESVGFRHVPREDLGDYPYARADVFMTYLL